MRSHRLLIAVLSASAVAVPLFAQSAGNVELGGFGQFTRPDGGWHVKNGFGAGGRLGVFLTNRWQLEGNVGFTSFDNASPRPSGSSSNQTFTGQVNYGIPFGLGGRTHQLLLEAGAGGQRFASHNDFTVPLGGGVRFMLSDAFALRFDGIVEWVENPTAPGFGFPQTIGVNSTAARSTNLELRGGLSFILGNHHQDAPPPPRQVAQAPQPRSEPPATPVRTEPAGRPAPSPAPNRDSIDAVNRAHAALVAQLFFDFDKSDLRDDQRGALDAKLPVLRANPSVRIRIEGNADERGSDEYNQALGMRRAQQARKYLVDHGIDANRIDISSNGEEKPVCQGHEESCWSQNRRDEFVIVAGEVSRY